MSAVTDVLGFLLLFIVLVYAIFGGATKIGNKITQKATSAGWGIVLFFIGTWSILLSWYGLTLRLGARWTFFQFLESILTELYDYAVRLWRIFSRGP